MASLLGSVLMATRKWRILDMHLTHPNRMPAARNNNNAILGRRKESAKNTSMRFPAPLTNLLCNARSLFARDDVLRFHGRRFLPTPLPLPSPGLRYYALCAIVCADCPTAMRFWVCVTTLRRPRR